MQDSTVASGSFSPKVIVPLVPRARARAAMHINNEKVLREQLIYKAFHEVNIVTARAGTVSGMSGDNYFRGKGS